MTRDTRLTAVGLVRSEWTKLWSVRSTWIILGLAFGITAALSCFAMFGGLLEIEEVRQIPFGWTAVYPLAMLVLVVLGTLTMSSEYGNGSIRTSMVAAPRRTGVLLAKAAVLTGVVSALTVAMTLVLYLVLQLFGDGIPGFGMSLFDPDMIGGVLGNAFTLPYMAALGLFLGAIVRSSAGAICLYFGGFQMLPQIAPAFLPDQLAGVVDYLPLGAIDVLRAGGLAAEPYGPTTALVVLATWLLVLGGAAWLLLRRRDV